VGCNSGDAGGPGAPAVAAGDCDSRQVTWTSGVDTPNDGFNISLSAQAGWDTDTVLTYHWATVASDFCGVGNYPGQPGIDYVIVHTPG
jgi:hypothetical protein